VCGQEEGSQAAAGGRPRCVRLQADWSGRRSAREEREGWAQKRKQAVTGIAGAACSCGWSGAQQREAPGWHCSGLPRAPGQALQPEFGWAAVGCLVRARQRRARRPRPEVRTGMRAGPLAGAPNMGGGREGSALGGCAGGCHAPAWSEGRDGPTEGMAGYTKPQRLAAGPQGGVAQARRSGVCGCSRAGGGGGGGGGGTRGGGERGKQGCGFGSAAERAAPELHSACGRGPGARDVWCCVGARRAGVRHR
jgi:hypothetical protein